MCFLNSSTTTSFTAQSNFSFRLGSASVAFWKSLRIAELWSFYYCVVQITISDGPSCRFVARTGCRPHWSRVRHIGSVGWPLCADNGSPVSRMGRRAGPVCRDGYWSDQGPATTSPAVRPGTTDCHHQPRTHESRWAPLLYSLDSTDWKATHQSCDKCGLRWKKREKERSIGDLEW